MISTNCIAQIVCLPIFKKMNLTQGGTTVGGFTIKIETEISLLISYSFAIYRIKIAKLYVIRKLI